MLDEFLIYLFLELRNMLDEFKLKEHQPPGFSPIKRDLGCILVTSSVGAKPLVMINS